MLQLGRNLANKYQRRTLRVLYGQTQAYPYAAQLSSAFVRTGGAIEGTTTTGITGGKAAILPGLVATKLAGEIVTVSGAADDDRPFGLFANYVGGELSDIPTDQTAVGVWRGNGSVFEILAPAFDDTSAATNAGNEVGTDTTEVYGASTVKGQLVFTTGGAGYDAMLAGTGPPPARLIKYLSANAVIVELLV